MHIFHINEHNDIITEAFNSLINEENDKHVIYFHNLSGFDIHFIIEILYKKYGDGLNIVYRNGKILGFDIKYKKLTFYFRDSYLLIPGSLNLLAKAFNCEISKGKLPYDFITSNTLNYIGKIPIEYGEYPDNYNIKDESKKYIINDLKLLYEITSKFTNDIEIKYGISVKKSFSISGLAMKIWRTKFYDLNHKIANLDKKTNDIIRDWYFGGIVNIYIPIYKGKIKYYDINSLYPYTMLKNMPIGMPEHIVYYKPIKTIDHLYGMVKVKVIVPDDIKWPFLNLP